MPASSPSPVQLSKPIARRPTGAAGTPSGTARTAPGYSSVEGDMRRRRDPPKKVLGGDEYALVRYTECRKNHAASVGGYAVDGCREFMASGEEGTPAALKCAACNCHRSFHKREVEREVLCDCSSNSASPK